MKRSFFLSSYSVTVRVKNYEAGVRLHQIRFAVKACLTGTGTAADKGVQIAAVFFAVESDTDCLRHQLVFGRWVLPVFLVHGFGIAPFCAAVFLSASVVPACREVDPDAHSIAEKQNEDSFYAVLAKLYMKWVAHHIHQARQYLRQATLNGWCNEKSEPHNRQDAEYGENDGGLSVVISIHDRSFPFARLP